MDDRKFNTPISPEDPAGTGVGSDIAPVEGPKSAEEVFREYAPRVYNLARRMLNSDADAEDATQDVLLQVVRKLASFRGESSFPTWLHRVTVNAALGLRRKRATHAEHVTNEALDTALENRHLAG